MSFAAYATQGAQGDVLLRWVESRWFGLADLTCAALSAVWWCFQPAAGGWPLAIGLLPWAGRLAAGRFPFRRTPLDVPLGVFVLSAVVGVWAAYNRETAEAKFWILAGALLVFYALAGQPRANLLAWPLLAGLIIVAVHGLLDDAPYGQQGTPLLWVLPGMAVAVTSGGERLRLSPLWTTQRVAGWFVASILLASAVLIPMFYKPSLAIVYANRGAVEMAPLELAGWPVEAINAYGTTDLSGAEHWFRSAFRLDPDNRTAQYRLGLIALQGGDYTSAVEHLMVAYQADIGHRGVQKALGYALVWQGQVEEAVPLLRQIPEARREMGYYAWWWETQGRHDLAMRAAKTARRLGADLPADAQDVRRPA